MTTQAYIDQNATPTFRKGDSVIMIECYEATLPEYKDRIWVCLTDSYLDKARQDVVFLEKFSGCFLSKFLMKVPTVDPTLSQQGGQSV